MGNLHLSTTQEQRLLPRMLQSVEILQLPALELDTFLRQAVQENEALLLEERPTPEAPGPRGGGARAGGEGASWWELQEGGAGGLAEWLQGQLGMLDLEAELESWVRLVIESLDVRGHLTVSDEVLLGHARLQGLAGGASELGRAIAVVQGLEPRGVGGRNAVEALLLQLDPGDPDYALLCRLLEDFLDELARNHLPVVARELGVGLEELAELMHRLGRLDPSPGAGFGSGAAPAIRPEVVVVETQGGFEVKIDASGLPSVSLDPEVVALARDAGQMPEVRSYLRGKLERARWIVEALEQRKATLLRVAQRAFHEQRGFLERGPSGLRPLSMSEVAGALGLHLSTVSRSVSGKYAETPWGVVALRSLFPAASGDGSVVHDEVAEGLMAVLAEEDGAAPLSDLDLVAALAKRGLHVARRTVAKYRKDLGIPSSYRRRKHT